MARPLTLAEIEATFRKWGVPYKVTAGAETRDNGSHWSGGDMVTGCMYHHTAGDATDAAELKVVTYGRPGLSGPLCNFGAGDDGTIYVVACGSANHAGKGDPDTLTMVQRETTPLDRDVKPNENQDSPRAVGGNSRFYGWESFYGIRNDPTPNPIQHRATVLSMAAIIDKLDEIDTANTWSGRSAIGHREWTTNKIDPSAVLMFEVRNLINQIRAAGPVVARVWLATGKFTAPTPKPAPATTTPTIALGGTVFMVKRKDRDEVYKTDGFRRVHVTRVERDALLKAKVPLFDGFTSDDELAAFGQEVTA